MFITCSARTREKKVLVIHLERLVPEKVRERKGLAKKSRKNESGGQHVECAGKNETGFREERKGENMKVFVVPKSL